MEPSENSNQPPSAQGPNQAPSATGRLSPHRTRAPGFFAKLIRPLRKTRKRCTTALKYSKRQDAILRGLAGDSEAQRKDHTSQVECATPNLTGRKNTQEEEQPTTRSGSRPGDSSPPHDAERQVRPGDRHRPAGLRLRERVMTALKSRTSTRLTDASVWRKEDYEPHTGTHSGARTSTPVPQSKLGDRDPKKPTIPNEANPESISADQKGCFQEEESRSTKAQNTTPLGVETKALPDRLENMKENQKTRQTSRQPFHLRLTPVLSHKRRQRPVDKAIWRNDQLPTAASFEVSRPIATSELRAREVYERVPPVPESSERTNTRDVQYQSGLLEKYVQNSDGHEYTVDSGRGHKCNARGYNKEEKQETHGAELKDPRGEGKDSESAGLVWRRDEPDERHTKTVSLPVANAPLVERAMHKSDDVVPRNTQKPVLPPKKDEVDISCGTRRKDS